MQSGEDRSGRADGDNDKAGLAQIAVEMLEHAPAVQEKRAALEAAQKLAQAASEILPPEEWIGATIDHLPDK